MGSLRLMIPTFCARCPSATASGRRPPGGRRPLAVALGQRAQNVGIMRRSEPMSEHKDQQLHASASEAVTNNVRVEVESRYAPELSQPFQGQWVFHYTVRITNEGETTVQLLSRHWIIKDATGHVEEVKGPGVVGEQP